VIRWTEPWKASLRMRGSPNAGEILIVFFLWAAVLLFIAFLHSGNVLWVWDPVHLGLLILLSLLLSCVTSFGYWLCPSSVWTSKTGIVRAVLKSIDETPWKSIKGYEIKQTTFGEALRLRIENSNEKLLLLPSTMDIPALIREIDENIAIARRTGP
jgi:hypothetical protein